ncbi:TetR/AcrR family transcriptional regulator [Magnetovibrio sp.]|uniref:TetR/AcrR family transcriptional regulator n=1 Tax=Magnetovibrio sp. TaxID=2024836 RepID=UPI002F95939D
MSKSPPHTDIAARPRKRMDREAREAHIVAEAISFFAEQGLEGKTRDLAARIGITQPLLYRYFPSKDNLIERVYQEVYVSRWNPDWETLIADRNKPLVERMIAFYRQYADAIYDYNWVRIFVFSGLKGTNINDRYLAHVRSKLIEPLCSEMRHEFALPTTDEVPTCAEECELVWSLHGMFFYRAIRHFVYNQPMIDNVDEVIANDVRTFLKGAPEAMKSIIAKKL